MSPADVSLASPSPSPSASQSGVSTGWAFRFGIAVTTALFVAGFFAPNFVTNSWSYLELSNTVFKDFFRANTVRNFDHPTLYSQAFPPLWPVILGIVRRVADLGIYTGFLLDYAICIALLGALILLFRRIDLPDWAGAACYLCALGSVGEIFSGGAIPLTLALLIGTLVILFGASLHPARIALAALLMGLACLSRFDALLTACVIGVAFAVRAYWLDRSFRRAVTVAAVYFAILAATLSPLVAYGMKHFGKPFPSDNTRMVTQTEGGGNLDYYKTTRESDLRQHPRQWIAGLLFHKLPRVAAVGIYELFTRLQTSAILFLTAILLVIWGAGNPPQLPVRARHLILLAPVLIFTMLVPSVLGGVQDSRYYSGPVLMVFTVLFIVLISLIPDVWNPRRTRMLLVAASLPLLPIMFLSVWIYAGGRNSRQMMAPVHPTPQMQKLTEAVRRDSGNEPHRLIFTDSTTAAAKYGALTGEPVSLLPALLSGTFADFARDWHITHLYTGSLERAIWEASQMRSDYFMPEIEQSGVELVPLDLPGLYRIRLR